MHRDTPQESHEDGNRTIGFKRRGNDQDEPINYRPKNRDQI